jgi:hypothetical protein
LQQQRLPGIYCMPAHSSPLIWWGVLFIRQGPYKGAVLRCVRGSVAESGSGLDPDSDWIRIQNQVSGSGFGIRIRIVRIQEGKNNPQK